MHSLLNGDAPSLLGYFGKEETVAILLTLFIVSLESARSSQSKVEVWKNVPAMHEGKLWR